MPRKNLKIASMRVATLIPTRMMTTLELVNQLVCEAGIQYWKFTVNYQIK